jgi:hypothetical protein
MSEFQRFSEKKNLNTIDELCTIIEHYMRFEVDGDNFRDEQHFENAVRAVLEQAGFKVQPKQDVKNTIASVNEKYFGDVNRQIPDISIQCKDGLVFLELKFKNTPQKYIEDIEKIANYLRLGKCDAAGVLFLDDTQYSGWEQCKKNPKYYYFWQLKKKA